MGDRRIGPHEADRDGSPTEVRSSGPDEVPSGARWDDDGGYEPDDSDTASDSDTPTTGGLFLRGILDSALPHELGTDDEPERYMVAAVFSRQVASEERALIEGAAARSTLAAHGYPGLGLKVADRRLEISGTNLAMLAAGLATAIAALLRDVEQQVATDREHRDDRRAQWSAAEAERAARVKAEADRVRFE